MTDKRINEIVEEAARLLRDNPSLKYYEAIERAKDEFKKEDKL